MPAFGYQPVKAAMGREITTIDIVKEAERHPLVRCMRSMAIHDN
jgi:hypothetical protein